MRCSKASALEKCSIFFILVESLKMNDTTLVLTSISLETTTCEAFHFFMFFNHVNVKFFFLYK